MEPQACNFSCVSAFSAAEGCAALRSNNGSDLTELIMSPALLRCHLASCETELFEECFPPATEEFCKQCVAQFDSNGGCEASEKSAQAHISEGCWSCGEQAMTHCAEKKMKMGGGEGCDACMRALGPPTVARPCSKARIPIRAALGVSLSRATMFIAGRRALWPLVCFRRLPHG